MKCPTCGNNPYDNIAFKVDVKNLVRAIKTLKERFERVDQALAAVEEALKSL